MNYCKEITYGCGRAASRLVRRVRRGFALIVTLSLMTLLLLMVLTLTTLVRLSLQTAQATLLDAQARQNALLAAYIAIGQLQKFAGPDQRTTTAADLFRRLYPSNDQTAQPPGGSGSAGGNFVSLGDSGGTLAPSVTGGTSYWTAVWANGSKPLSLYSSAPNQTNGLGGVPDPILLNWLVSGTENTPLQVNVGTTGEVPQSSPNIVADVSKPGTKPIYPILFLPGPKDLFITPMDPVSTSALSSNLYIKINPSSNLQPGNDLLMNQGNQTKSAVLLVGPNTVGNLAGVELNARGPGSNAPIYIQNEVNNYIIAPLVPVTIPTDPGVAGVITAGRYAYWVGDEGLKAKYNPINSYGALGGSGTEYAATAAGQLARYEFTSPLRNAMEVMDAQNGFYNYATMNGPNANPYSQNGGSSAAALLNSMIEPIQVLLAEPTAINPEVSPATGGPNAYLQQHYFDFTTYSYGVLADTLRGGLRYDLTTAFEPSEFAPRLTSAGNNYTGVISVGAAMNPVYGAADPNSLAGKSFLPIFGVPTSAGAGGAIYTTEPNALSGNATAGYAPVYGPASAPSWDLLLSYYNIASVVANANGGDIPVQIGGNVWNSANGFVSPLFAPIPLGAPSAGGLNGGQSMQAVSISPIILQGRLQFGIFSNSAYEEMATVEAVFVLANPYNFPIVAPSEGIDLSYRISTPTGHEWVMDAAPRDARRGVNGGPSNGDTYFPFQDTADSNITNLAGGFFNVGGFNGSSGNFVTSNFGYSTANGNAAYLPINTNLQSFPTEGQQYSVLDHIAFHINKGQVWRPGEAIAFGLALPNPGIDLGVGAALPYAAQPNGTILSTATCVGGFFEGTAGSTNSTIWGTGGGGWPASVVLTYPIPLAPITPSSQSPVGTFFMVDTGASTSPAIVQIAGNNKTPVPNGNNGNGNYDVADNYPFPDPKTWGWITDLFPSNATTLEMRLGGSQLGANVLQQVINLDLTGAGVNSASGGGVIVNEDNALQDAGYRHSYISDSVGGNVTVGEPAFIGGYYFMMAPPASMEYDYFRNNNPVPATNLTAAAGNINFRDYADYNLRAVHMAMPPWVAWDTPQKAGYNGYMTGNFLTVPPYFSFFDQGGFDGGSNAPNPGGQAPGSHFADGITAWDDAPFPADGQVPWGYSDDIAEGDPFVVLYGLPQRVKASSAPLTTLNQNRQKIPDVPIMSLGQLQHADVTADDVWVSVSYEPGNAIGNSWYNPYVRRDNSIQSTNGSGAALTNQSAWTNINAINSSQQIKQLATTGGPTNGGAYLGAQGAQIHAYDISYLMNVALWDRYFFSTLETAAEQSGALADPPANTRLKYAAGFWPTNGQLVANGGTTVLDPTTGKQMFKTFAPARYLMIDGAFNINSTSVEAWKAVLSAMRDAAYPGGGAVGGAAAGNGFVNLPRALASGAMASTPYSTAEVVGDGEAGTDNQSYAGFRELTDNDIDALAVNIIQQIRLRGPFLSLAQFVNRRLSQYITTSTGGVTQSLDPYGYSGVIQTALDYSKAPGNGNAINYLAGAATGADTISSSAQFVIANWIPSSSEFYPNNNAAGPQENDPLYPPFNSHAAAAPSADPNSLVLGIPGWLTQADVLEAIGSVIAARSDTFVVRSYGDVLNPLIDQSDSGANIPAAITNDPTNIESRAWCEVVVQRYPDYIDTSVASGNDPATTVGANAPNPGYAGTLSAVNQAFGRRFKIVSLRWLNPSDI